MATTAVPTRTNGQRANGQWAPGRARPATRRGPGSGRQRQLPLVVVGVLLVIGCALGFTVASLRLGARQEVLVVARPLAVGQMLTAADVGSVRVSVGAGLQVVPVADESSVLGRQLAVPLVAGALLTRAEVGAPSPVGSGSDVVAVGLKPGGYPPDLAAGDRVQVVPVTPATSSAPNGASAGSPVAATVLAVDGSAGSAGSGGPTVFSLQVAATDAGEVAALAAAGQASLIQVGAGG